MRSFIIVLVLALGSTVAVAGDANNCVQDVSDQYATGMKNTCNQSIIVTYCFSSSYCDAPKGQGRDGHQIRPGTIIVIGNAGKKYHYHACVFPEFPDGERGCAAR